MKVYCVCSCDFVTSTDKVESVHRSFEGANEAMLSLADYDVGNGEIHFKHQDSRDKVSIHYIPDEDEHNPQWTNTIRKSYYIVERELLK